MAKYVTEENFNYTMGDIRSQIGGLNTDFAGLKQDVRVFRDDIMVTLDGMTAILLRLDQERVFTSEWIRRIESDVTRIKQQLKIA